MYVHVCTCTCTHVRACARRRRRPQEEELVLSFRLTTGLFGWMEVAWQAHCALFAPCFSFKSLQGNAIVRNTKGRKCHRSATHPRGSVKDNTSKWSREKGEQEREQEKEQDRQNRRVPETGLCALTDLVPWERSKSQGYSLVPLENSVDTEKTLWDWVR